MDTLLTLFRVETIVALAGVVGVITQLVKLAPPEWTSNYPKTVALVVAAVIVGAIGVYQKADLATMASVTILVATVAYGLYDVAKGIYAKLKKK